MGGVMNNFRVVQSRIALTLFTVCGHLWLNSFFSADLESSDIVSVC